MRLHILSDLHLEFGDYQPPHTQADVVVLAGDIHQGTKGINWIKLHFPDTSVIYVIGNHEYYGHAIPDLTQTIKHQVAGSRIHVLENNGFKLGGFVFLGCTLWTDFQLGPDAHSSMLAAEQDMNDFSLIEKRGHGGRFRASDAAKIHARSVRWLKTQLSRHDPRQTVVVTHHAPSPFSIPPVYAGDELSAAFASDLNPFIKASGICLWIHGHTHYNVDYQIGQTRIYSNQRGYPGQISPVFEADAVIEI
jgi:predicted phosphohydrolase